MLVGKEWKFGHESKVRGQAPYEDHREMLVVSLTSDYRGNLRWLFISSHLGLHH